MLAVAIGTFFIGGYWLWTGLVLVVLVTRIMDIAIGDHLGVHPAGASGLAVSCQIAIVPMLGILTLLYLYYIGGERMNWLDMPMQWLGVDIAAARMNTGFVGLIGGTLTLGLFHGALGVITGHEFLHRPDNAAKRIFGKLLIAPICFPALVLEHVGGHHANVGLLGDPETAPRGQGFWRFMAEDYSATTRDAFVREKARLARRNSGWFTTGNRLLQGAVLSVLTGFLFFAAAGLAGLAAFVSVAFIGVLCTTLFSYIAHYGLIRVPGTPVAARHSWNSYRFWSTSVMFNLPRHASHHLHGNRPYWKLEVEAGAPVFPHGATMMAGIALLPPLWRKVMTGPLEDWDRNYATAGELQLLAR